MPPTLILVRHAQALHNVDKDYDIPDPDLSEHGREQLKSLRQSLSENPLAQQAGIIIASPMRRTIQTALASLDWLIEQGVKVQADAGWQENSAKPCDVGTPVSKLSSEFPSVDFSELDPVYPDKTSPAGAHYWYTRKALLHRAQSSLRKLYERPERVIIVVSHSGFLRLAVSGCWFYNADYRIFDFADDDGVNGDMANVENGSEEAHLKLRERPETRRPNEEISGGLGWSSKTTVVLGSDLPDEEPESVE